MESVDTRVTARWVVPVEPAGSVLEDHAVAIRGGRIVAVLPATEARARFGAAEILERPDHVLLPGLVNAHTHAAMVLLRGRAENLPLGRWLRSTVWPLERRWVDPDYVRDGTTLAIAEMLRAGITCFAGMHLWPDVVAQTAAAAHIRASVGLVVTEAATRWAGTADEYIDRGMQQHRSSRLAWNVSGSTTFSSIGRGVFRPRIRCIAALRRAKPARRSDCKNKAPESPSKPRMGRSRCSPARHAHDGKPGSTASSP